MWHGLYVNNDGCYLHDTNKPTSKTENMSDNRKKEKNPVKTNSVWRTNLNTTCDRKTIPTKTPNCVYNPWKRQKRSWSMVLRTKGFPWQCFKNLNKLFQQCWIHHTTFHITLKYKKIQSKKEWHLLFSLLHITINWKPLNKISVV